MINFERYSIEIDKTHFTRFELDIGTIADMISRYFEVDVAK